MAGSGLRAWAPNGEVIVNTDDRFNRIIGSGTFPAPNHSFPDNDSFHQTYVNGLQPGPDCSVVASGGGYILVFSDSFQWRVGQIGIGPGGLIHWTAWAR